MHPKLAKAPVQYVVAQIRFSTIEKIEDYVDNLQDKIRKSYPHYIPVKTPGVQFRAGQQGPIPVMHHQWHFLDKDKKVGIVLDKSSLTIHTNSYEQFGNLMEHIKLAAVECQKILEIPIITGCGLRYINFIKNNEIVNIDPKLQGFKLSGKEFEKASYFLNRTETTQNTSVGFIRIQATHINDPNIKHILSLVPPDLIQVASNLSFKSNIQSDKNFMLLDIDHINSNQYDFEIEKIVEIFNKLHQIMYTVFCKAVGNANIKKWK